LSNYWYPKLYFQDPVTKTFTPVSNGGLLVYYQNRGDGDVSNGGKGLKVIRFITKFLKGRIQYFMIGLPSWPQNAHREPDAPV